MAHPHRHRAEAPSPGRTSGSTTNVRALLAPSQIDVRTPSTRGTTTPGPLGEGRASGERGRLEAAQHRDDLADDPGVVAVDGESFTLRQLLDSDDGITVWGCA